MPQSAIAAEAVSCGYGLGSSASVPVTYCDFSSAAPDARGCSGSRRLCVIGDTTRPCGDRNGRQAPGRRGSVSNLSRAAASLMLFYPVTRPDVPPCCAATPALSLLGAGAGMVALGVADLALPPGLAWAEDGRSALVATGAGTIRSGDAVVFLKPVAVAPAVVLLVTGGPRPPGTRRSTPGWAWPEDRLGTAPLGQASSIGQIAAGVHAAGQGQGRAAAPMTPGSDHPVHLA